MNNARLHLDKCLNFSIHEQLQITSINQAKRLGQCDRKGTIQAGKNPDIVVIGQDGEEELTTYIR
ncbi:amidohydrolase family protein [Sporosarcina sp. NPDC096371]|uniref:amidohydrolase family protein n=1 Tax=Sporosarcina sp. NPDC096371 TaxID=3364530 RepID=UPI003808F963